VRKIFPGSIAMRSFGNSTLLGCRIPKIFIGNPFRTSSPEIFIKNAFFEKFETRLNAKTFKAAFCIVLNESE
jgi:hypothetical protein